MTDKNWDEVMKLAEGYGFIVQAYGGIATLATHEEQKKAGIYEKTQEMCRRGLNNNVLGGE